MFFAEKTNIEKRLKRRRVSLLIIECPTQPVRKRCVMALKGDFQTKKRGYGYVAFREP